MSEVHQIENLDLNLIPSLYWLLTERNVTEAARRVGITQSAMSRALGRLRDLYGDPLLIKSGKKMLVTPMGETLLPLVGKAVRSLQDVTRVSDSFDPATHSGSFRIACKDHVGAKIIAAWANHVAPYAPGLNLELTDITFGSVPDMISGKIDLAVMPMAPTIRIPPEVNLEQFVMKPIYEEGFLTCVRQGHPLANQKLDAKTFAAANHILINPEGMSRGVVDEALEREGLTRRISYYTTSFLLALPIVLKTDCILTAPSTLINVGVEGLHVFDPPVEVEPMKVYGGWHPNWTLDARHKWTREKLFEGMACHDHSVGLNA